MQCIYGEIFVFFVVSLSKVIHKRMPTSYTGIKLAKIKDIFDLLFIISGSDENLLENVIEVFFFLILLEHNYFKKKTYHILTV